MVSSAEQTLISFVRSERLSSYLKLERTQLFKLTLINLQFLFTDKSIGMETLHEEGLGIKPYP